MNMDAILKSFFRNTFSLMLTTFLFVGCVAGDLEKPGAAEKAGLTEEGLLDKVNKISKLQVSHRIAAFNVKPSPEQFKTPTNALSPFKRSVGPFNLLIAVDNPLGENYIHKWYRNGVNIFTESNQVSALFVDVSNSNIWPLGVNTIVSSIIDPKDNSLVESVAWSFIVNDFNDPTFSFVCSPSSFGNCDPLPLKMTTVTSDDRPTIFGNVSNPDNVDYYIKWFLDGVEQTSSPYPSRPSISFLVDPADLTKFPKGKHTLYLEARRTPTGPIFLQKTWDIEISYPPPTKVTGAKAITGTTPPAITDPSVLISNFTQDPTNDRIFSDNTLYHSVSGNVLDENSNENNRFGFYIAPAQNANPDTTRGTPIHDFCVYIEDGTGLSASEGVYIVFFDENGRTITADGTINRLTFKGGPNPDPVCLSGYGALSGNGNPSYSKNLIPADSLALASNKEIYAKVIDGLSGQLVGEVHWDNITITPANTAPILERDESGNNVDNLQAGIFQGGGTDNLFALAIKDKDSSVSPGLNLTDYAINFSICTPDKDCTNVANFSPIDGSNPHWFLADVPNPDCTYTSAEAVSGKNICKLRFPSYNDEDNDGNTSPVAAGEYVIKATVSDNQTNGTDGPSRISNEVTWSINVGESNTAPTIDPVPATPSPGNTQAGLNANTDSFIFDSGDNTTAIALADEGDTITFNLYIKDLERDTFKVEVSYKGYVNGIEDSSWTPIPSITQNNVAHPTEKILYNQSWQIPTSVIQGGPANNATENVTIRVVISDVPGVGINPQSLTQDFVLAITNSNPAPVLAGDPDPLTNGIFNVFEGRIFSLYPGDITDASPAGGDGTNITYKWQTYSQTGTNDCTSIAGSSWTDVEGAVGQFSNTVTSAQPSKLLWTPPSSLYGPNSTSPFDGSNLFDPANNKVCFRVCVGDDGIGNNVDDCVVNRVWSGSAGFGLVRFINKAERKLPNITSADLSHDVWIDDSTIANLDTQDMDVWTVHSVGTNLIVQKFNVDNKGIFTESFKSTSIASDPTDNVCSAPGAPSAEETPFDISITGNDSHIFVAYRIVEVDTIPTGAPLMRFIVLTKDSDPANIESSKRCLKLDIVASQVGQIVASDEAWYLPFLETVNENKVALAFGKEGDSALETAQAAYNVDGNYVRLNSGIRGTRVRNVLDTFNTTKRLIVATQREDGKIDIRGHEVTIGSSNWDGDGINDNDPRAVQGANEKGPFVLDSMDQFELSMGYSGIISNNQFLYIAGSNPSSQNENELMIARRKLDEAAYLEDDLSLISSGGIVSLYDENGEDDLDLKDLKAIDVAAGDTDKSLIIGVMDAFNEVKVIRVGCVDGADVNCVDADGDDRISRKINNEIPVTDINNKSFKMSKYLPTIQHGKEGYDKGKHKMDSVLINLLNNNSEVVNYSIGVEPEEYQYPIGASSNSDVGFPILCSPAFTNGCSIGN